MIVLHSTLSLGLSFGYSILAFEHASVAMRLRKWKRILHLVISIALACLGACYIAEFLTQFGTPSAVVVVV